MQSFADGVPFDAEVKCVCGHMAAVYCAICMRKIVGLSQICGVSVWANL